MINHAYELLNQVKEIKKEITEEKYKEVFEKTEKMLSCLQLQCTFALYNDRLEDVANSRWKEHQPNVRELESGVDVTAAVDEKILFSKIKRDDNLIQLRQECIHRNIANAAALGWKVMIAAIQEQERQHHSKKCLHPERCGLGFFEKLLQHGVSRESAFFPFTRELP